METAWAIAGTIAGVIVGSIGTYIIESRTIRREEILAARLELPPMRSVIWDDNPLRLREQAGRIRARTTLLGVDQSLVGELETAAFEFNQDWHASRDIYGGPEQEMPVDAQRLDRLDAAINALDDAIVRANRRFGRKRRGTTSD